MYTHSDDRNVEKICYEQEHIQKVLEVIQNNFDSWFDLFLETENGIGISQGQIDALRARFKIGESSSNKQKDKSAAYKRIIAEAIDEFEKDREDYQNIFDMETLEEYEDDLNTFKSKVLKDKCPIIRKTIQNRRAKQLDKYRADFNRSNPSDLLRVVTNLCQFEEDYQTMVYDEGATVSIDTMGLKDIDTEEYTVYGVIGGGIKSHMLFKVNPKFFPNRSQFALWALWFLTDKRSFGCSTDSEFLMIDVKKCTTQQNYYYPYTLFSYYAYEIYELLRAKADELNAYIDEDYRYVIVDAFLTFIANQHADDINLLISQIRNEDYYEA